MAIAANFRRHPEAMALQLVLAFGKPCWHTARPTTRLGRAARAFITRRVREIGPVVYPEKRPSPSWIAQARKRAARLAAQVKQACMALDFAAVLRFETYALFPWLLEVQSAPAAASLKV